MRLRSAFLTLLFLFVSAAFLAPPPAWALCAPSTRGIFPASGIVGTSVPATVKGDGLAGATVDVFGEPGLAAAVVNSADDSISLQLTIDPAAVPGERILTFTTSAGAVALSFTVNAAGGPVLDSVSPTPIATQGFGLDLVLLGSGFTDLGPANVTVSGLGVTVVDALPSLGGTRLDLSLDVAADAEVGTHAVSIQSAAGGVVFQLYVQRPAPVVTKVSPAAGEVGTQVALTITGENLTGAALVVTSGDKGQGGVTVLDVSTTDDATLVATLDIAGTLSAEAEPRLLILTTESGQVTTEFFVVAAGVPSITSISPPAGEPDTTVPVTIRGLHLTDAVLTTTSGTITLQNQVNVDDETITVDVVVPDTATPDPDTGHTIIATVGTDTASTSFVVIGVGEPFIGAVRPPFGNRGSTLTLFVDGVNLGSLDALDPLTLTGPGIAISNVSSVDESTTVRAIFDIASEAPAGHRDLTITTTSGSVERDQAFRVNVPGQVPVITDVTPSAVEPGATTQITVTGTGFFGAGVSVGGLGATVSNLVVNETGTVLTFDLTLEAAAPAENRLLIVVTENGSDTCGVLSLGADVLLRAAKILKTGSVFEVTTAGYRLFSFEFSLNENFAQGPRTYLVATDQQSLTLTRLQAENVGRAVRDLPFVYVRVRAISATNIIGLSGVFRVRR